jgi:hypothetical protein
MVIKSKVIITSTKVTHSGSVTVKQIEVIEDSKDYKQAMKRYSSYKRWGNVLVSYIPNTRQQTTVIITKL